MLSCHVLRGCMVPMAVCKVQAGFPSPAEDYLESLLSLDDYLIDNLAATFFVKIIGNSMSGLGICEGDIAVVNRALTPKTNDIVIAVVDNEFLIKELIVGNGMLWLKPHYPNYPNIPLREARGDMIWGVVSGIVRKYR